MFYDFLLTACWCYLVFCYAFAWFSMVYYDYLLLVSYRFPMFACDLLLIQNTFLSFPIGFCCFPSDCLLISYDFVLASCDFLLFSFWFRILFLWFSDVFPMFSYVRPWSFVCFFLDFYAFLMGFYLFLCFAIANTFSNIWFRVSLKIKGYRCSNIHIHFHMLGFRGPSTNYKCIIFQTNTIHESNKMTTTSFNKRCKGPL